ncbi:MAG: succinylglutamate desuccinylase/aspartoacylase family protein [Ectothiorhodospiraceae bacterium]|nr:succinylglutamate desuccinylase/aspartoacylase family protein [Ectothiorhodospiraceae bacterium]
MSGVPCELQHYDGIPDGFLDAGPRDLAAVLGGPSLIRLPGKRRPPLFVSAILHGNEPAGLEAVQRLLRAHRRGPLPRELVIFVGNVHAAAAGVRRLDGQPDYNRIWPGTEETGTPEADMAAEVVRLAGQDGLFASIDVHNNTGLNPHYGCINRLEARFLGLASLFSRTVVYFTRPLGVQSLAFAPLCPAVTLECGRAGDRRGSEHAFEFLDAVLHLQTIPDHPAQDDLGLFRTVARVRIPETQTFGFGEQAQGIRFFEDLERMNFRELPAGTPIAAYTGPGVPLLVEDDQGEDVAERYFRDAGGELVTARGFMPSMLTLDERVIRQDCLCYLMERLALP